MLHLELTTGVSSAARAHGLWVEDADLDEVVGCELLKPGPVPSPLCFARFHQSPKTWLKMLEVIKIPRKKHRKIVKPQGACGFTRTLQLI